MKREIIVDINLTVEELANEFCEIDAEAQAKFLSIVCDTFKSWGDNKMLNQIYYISESRNLTFDAQDFIKELNNYVNNKD